MKRRDTALNPANAKPPAPARVCGARLNDGSGTCQAPVSGPHPCRHHGGPTGYDEAPKGLPDGLVIHKVFKQEDRQRELEKYISSILEEYQLNEAADLRQVILSGVAYVRLLFDGGTKEPREMDYLSRIVDRHLRNLRATPKERAAPTGHAGGIVPGGDQQGLVNGAALGMFFERVRGVLSPAELAKVASGGQVRMAAPAQALDVADEVENEGDLTPDPFGD